MAEPMLEVGVRVKPISEPCLSCWVSVEPVGALQMSQDGTACRDLWWALAPVAVRKLIWGLSSGRANVAQHPRDPSDHVEDCGVHSNQCAACAVARHPGQNVPD